MRKDYKDILIARVTGKTLPHPEIPLQQDALMLFHSELSEQEMHLARCFESISTARERHIAACTLFARLRRPAQAGQPIPSPLREAYSIVDAENELVRASAEAASQAGSAFIVMDGLLKTTSDRLCIEGTKRLALGRLVNTVPLARLIWAAANNARHYPEWGTPDRRSQPSIDALGIAGIQPPWNRNLCDEVFGLIGWQNIDRMYIEIKTIAQEIILLVGGPDLRIR